ncbi:hypothetical protein AAG906_029317 [Vitis piasezkii]
MSTPSKSRSSAMGNEDYFNWCESMERCQHESERQMQALLHETRRLREENEVLLIQVSSSGPSRSRRPRSQRSNSRQNEEAMYPRNADSNSTRVLAKRRRRPYSKWNLTAWMSSCKFFKGVPARKPPTTMDDLFKGANKYSMLEDDVHAPTHLVLTYKGQGRQRQSNQANLIPLSISYDKLIPMSRDLFDFRWRDRKCAYHKDHGHTTK